MRLILECIHGNSKVFDSNGKWYWRGRQITILPKSHSESVEQFSELYNFFTQSLGPSFDTHTIEVLHPVPTVRWTYQLDPNGYQHRFFIKHAEDLDWFQLKYSHCLTKWSR